MNRGRMLRAATATLAIGVLAMVAGVVDPESSMMLVGVGLTLGSCAYRSALKTRLGLVRPSRLRTALELAAVGAVLLASLLQTGFLGLIYANPISTVVIPAGVVIAYLVAKRRR